METGSARCFVGPEMEFRCEECGKTFVAEMDHGKPRRFCSRTCFRAKAQRRVEAPCLECGTVFRPTDDQSKYCSMPCAVAGRRTRRLDKTCINCGKGFDKASAHNHNRDRCCSRECRDAFYKEDRSPAYQRGYYLHSRSNEKHLLVHRDGWVGEYMGEHRVIASRVIGRMLTRREYVIRVNRDPSDNSEENLFICDIVEFCKRRNGSLPWPTKGNLHEYGR
jgi:hypothetical protein